MRGGHHPPGILRTLFPGVSWELPRGSKGLLLSFDDGPVPGATDWILDVLKEYNINAAFFCLGERVENHPRLFERIGNEGHLVGNHGYFHLDGWKTSFRTYRDNLQRGEAVTGSLLFRPPYGRMNPLQYLWVRKRYRIVMWTYLAYDFNNGVSGRAIADDMFPLLKPGAVIGLHDAAYTVAERKGFFRDLLNKIREDFGSFQIQPDSLQVPSRREVHTGSNIPVH